MAIIEIDHVTKEFRLGQQTSLRDTLRGAWARVRGCEDTSRRLFKALDDVAFSIDAGEVVGLIGVNGAGKSTLLKVISGITDATTGTVRVGGRIAPLIEVGAGLHPELTGRENIYLNASILGVSRKVIRGKIDEIADFAELEDFLDTPIKRYSSGMKVRLGFAIATSVDAEILVVDEVLAVGDLAFQRKCFDLLEELIRRQNRTVLLVSHNIRQINRLCSRAILLDAGQKVADDGPDVICTLYYERSNRLIAESKLVHQRIGAREKCTAGILHIEGIALLDRAGNVTRVIQAGFPLDFHVSLRADEPVSEAEIVIGTHTTDFVYLTAHSTLESLGPITLCTGRHAIRMRIHEFPAKPGPYSLRLLVFGKSGNLLFSRENLYTFQVAPSSSEYLRPPLRLIDTPATWKLGVNDASAPLLSESTAVVTHS
jgi:lipopolysaccharide transport system ATP-binding protein